MAKESKRQSAGGWQKRLDASKKAFEKWDKQGESIIKRYRDERATLDTKKRRFNILWSNIQVMTPALYGRPAKPEVSRRFKDGDEVGRVASNILERGLEYDVEQYSDFDQAMKGSVEDRLLPGRGTSWIRYEPHITKEVQVSNSVEASIERVDYECAPVDYVNWRDFRHNPARTWDEVWWVARCVWMDREAGKARFGEVFADVTLENEDRNKTGTAEELPKDSQEQKAKVWEIWDRKKKQVIWIADGYKIELDRKDDPLELEEFFPCPRPLFATTTTGSLIPVPDYCEYQDQAEELDTLTQRIHLLTRALKVAGVYNGEFKELQRLLNEGVDNTMIGVSAWAAFAEKGALQGAVVFLPIKEIAEVIANLVTLRQQVLTDIWQIMGLSDIMRGSTEAEETLGAQELKAQFGSMRLKVVQGDVARYASDIFRLKAQVMCKHFDPKTLIAMSGIEYTPEGANPELVAKAIQLLKSGELKDFRINVESDSLAQIDEAAEKKETAEFITSMGAILREAGPVVQAAPAMLPFIGELMRLAARKQRVGRTVEQALEKSLEATKQQIEQDQVNPEQAKQVQEELQVTKQQLAEEKQRTALEAQKHQDTMQLEATRSQNEIGLQQQKDQAALAQQAQKDAQVVSMEQWKFEKTMELERYKFDREMELKREVAQADAEIKREAAKAQAAAKSEAKAA